MCPISVGLKASVLRSVIIVLIICNLRIDVQTLPNSQFQLNMYFLIPANTTNAVANRTAAALVVAINTIRANNILNDIAINWHVGDPQCSRKLATTTFYNMWANKTETPHVVFSGYCEEVCQVMALISNALNMPFFGIACRPNVEHNHELFPTFLPIDYDRTTSLPTVIALMRAFKWKTLGIMTTNDPTAHKLGLHAKMGVESQGWETVFLISTMNSMEEGFKSKEAEVEIDNVLDDMKKQARIILLAMERRYGARVLIVAQKKGMYNGEYAFIGYDVHLAEPEDFNATEEEWRTARVGLISITPRNVYTLLEGGKFVDLVSNQAQSSSVPPQLGWIEPLRSLYLKDLINVRYAGALYMAVRVYASIVQHMLTNIPREDIAQTESIVKNGTLLFSKIEELSEEAFGSDLMINENRGMLFDTKGTSIAVWLLINSIPETAAGKVDPTIFTHHSINAKPNETLETMHLIWPGGSTKAPSDTPYCGWNDEKCISPKELILIYTGSILGFLILVGVFVAIYVSRRMKLEGEKRTLVAWQVKWSGVVVIGDSVIGRSSVHGQSMTSFATSSLGEHPRSITNRLYTLTGTYRGKMVALKKINRDTVNILEPTIYNEIKQLFYINHENVNPFIGVCSEAPNVCVLMLYADRGSLQDVLAETKYDMNWEFRTCLATDIAKGMDYLHESPIGPHGHLTSANCVVDRKWECRITDYGLKLFKRSKTAQIGVFRWNSDLLWTAPEILKKPETDRDRVYGTREGDVYSFGIIVFEVITKELPYHAQLESITPEDAILKLKSDPQFRPTLPKPDSAVATSWNSLATICWHQKPDVRPSFRTIQGKLKSIHGSKIPNLMDRMQHMMEDALQAKATSIMDERKKTETVVYNLLPQSVAERFVGGKEIRPQQHSSVTLCFCQTTDIYPTLRALTPANVTEILKSLYDLYDDVIRRHKVMEIGGRGSKDSLILASGLPDYTGKHAEDICEMSLDLISEALAFKTPLTPALSPNLKISVHSGPALAAVIWRTFPRYCVNGEAFETVRAMQSTSKAMRVRISEVTYKRIKESGGFACEQGEKVTIQGGKSIKTFWLTGKTGNRKSLPIASNRKSSSRTSEGLRKN